MCLTWPVVATLLVRLKMKLGSVTSGALIATGRRLILAGVLLLVSTSNYAQCELELVEFNFDTGYIEVVIGEDCPSTDAVGLCIHLGVDTFYCGDWGSAFFHPTMYFMDFQAQFWVSPTTGIAYPGDTIILDAAVNSVGSSSNPYTVWECFQQHQYYDPSCDGGWVAIWQVNGSNGNPGPNDAPWESVNTNSDDWIDSTFESTAIALPNGCCPLADTVYLAETDTVVEYVDVLVVDTLIEYIYLESDTVFLTETDTLLFIDSIPYPVYIHDTTYVLVIEVDTSYYYEYDAIYIDCETGHMCSTLDLSCPIYIPNSFTPNNDGYNDVWGAETSESCWDSWSLRVYSRFGEMIWEGLAPDIFWLGGDQYYVPSGVYTYKLACTSSGDGYIINGHVSVVR